MKVEFEIQQGLLKKLKDLNENLGKYSFIVLSDEEEKVLKELMGLVFDSVTKQEQYQKAKESNKDKVCKCGHDISFHSLIGDRICCFINCECFMFTTLEPTAKA